MTGCNDLVLWRAVAYLLHYTAQEHRVFFEAPPSSEAAARVLHALLPVVWAVPPHHVGFYNLCDEAEHMRCHATGDASTGDARLFETGFSPAGPSYADPARTQLLVRPHTHARLVLGQQRALMLAAMQTLVGNRP